jgi:hypothetical protein
MYSRLEAAQVKQEFWTTFGKYMSPVLSAEGEKVSWVNYKTGEKNIFFRMNADNKLATVSIEFNHDDPESQQIYFEQATTLKKFLADPTGKKWAWQVTYN